MGFRELETLKIWRPSRDEFLNLRCNFFFISLSDETKVACFTVANKQKRNSLINRSLSFFLPLSLDVISEQLSLQIKTTILKSEMENRSRTNL